jgi:hypothetical protein
MVVVSSDGGFAMLTKDLLALAGRKPAGVERFTTTDEVWDYQAGETLIAVNNPITKESFAFDRGDLAMRDLIAIRKAILREAARLRQVNKQKGVIATQLTLTT